MTTTANPPVPFTSVDSDLNTDSFDADSLSRRRLLGGLSAIGLGAAGALAFAQVAGAATATTKKRTTTTTKKRTTTTTKRATTTTKRASTASSATVATSTSCTLIPEETGGPYPGDGTNGPNALTVAGVVRSDIRSSFGGSSTAAATGVPLTIKLTILSSANGCAPMTNGAVYLWHCDATGRYSMYSQGVTGENFLRGVQPTAADGTLAFQSVFPGAYDGRWPHIHFHVFSGLATATNGRSAIATSQLAIPEETCRLVYATSGYGSSLSNMSRTTLANDNVFRDDGAVHQLATMTGSVANGFVASLTLTV